MPLRKPLQIDVNSSSKIHRIHSKSVCFNVFVPQPPYILKHKHVKDYIFSGFVHWWSRSLFCFMWQFLLRGWLMNFTRLIQENSDQNTNTQSNGEEKTNELFNVNMNAIIKGDWLRINQSKTITYVCWIIQIRDEKHFCFFRSLRVECVFLLSKLLFNYAICCDLFRFRLFSLINLKVFGYVQEK